MTARKSFIKCNSNLIKKAVKLPKKKFEKLTPVLGCPLLGPWRAAAACTEEGVAGDTPSEACAWKQNRKASDCRIRSLFLQSEVKVLEFDF